MASALTDSGRLQGFLGGHPMGFSTVLIVALAAGVVLVVGGGLMVYMGNLVRSAYEIKVQITTEVDERLTKMADDLDKKSRWIKRDLLEEIEKIKIALQTDSGRKIAELSDPLVKHLERLEAAVGSHHAELTKALELDRQVIAGLDQRVKALQRQADKAGKAEPAPEAPGPLDEAAAILAARASVAAPTATEPAPEAPPPTVPAGLALPELGGGTRS